MLQAKGEQAIQEWIVKLSAWIVTEGYSADFWIHAWTLFL
ncbi:hypothetical protein L682_24825 [Aquipseudomonas alcaligenes OT 69]|nr:hypothetical protein L682_24825 [Pseudomonas alcaligenes OT 69]